MKKIELENKTVQELTEMLKNAKINLGRLKFESANRPLKDNSQFMKLRREIAQILTRINSLQHGSR